MSATAHLCKHLKQLLRVDIDCAGSRGYIMAATSSDGLDWQMSNGGYPVMYPGGQWDRVKCAGRHGITSLVLSCTAASLYTCLGCQFLLHPSCWQHHHRHYCRHHHHHRRHHCHRHQHCHRSYLDPTMTAVTTVQLDPTVRGLPRNCSRTVLHHIVNIVTITDVGPSQTALDHHRRHGTGAQTPRCSSFRAGGTVSSSRHVTAPPMGFLGSAST